MGDTINMSYNFFVSRCVFLADLFRIITGPLGRYRIGSIVDSEYRSDMSPL